MAVEEATGRSSCDFKRLLTCSQTLMHFNPGQEIALSCAALAYWIDAVLAHQLADGSKE